MQRFAFLNAPKTHSEPTLENTEIIVFYDEKTHFFKEPRPNMFLMGWVSQKTMVCTIENTVFMTRKEHHKKKIWFVNPERVSFL